jgi:hypothetical protein
LPPMHPSAPAPSTTADVAPTAFRNLRLDRESSFMLINRSFAAGRQIYCLSFERVRSYHSRRGGQAYYSCRGKLAAMFDNIDKKEISRLFILAALFIVIAYFFARWLMTV